MVTQPPASNIPSQPGANYQTTFTQHKTIFRDLGLDYSQGTIAHLTGSFQWSAVPTSWLGTSMSQLAQFSLDRWLGGEHGGDSPQAGKKEKKKAAPRY